MPPAPCWRLQALWLVAGGWWLVAGRLACCLFGWLVDGLFVGWLAAHLFMAAPYEGWW